ncbi:MAG: Holliday junction branch migration protein RuvA [Acidobacteria bacterium]|nr:Holliday junction branch migration protein RuvA [Acidobacteriota bacterium]
MIGRLSGTLLEARPDRVLLDVGGVGFEVSIPLGTFTMLPKPSERATLLVKTIVREDAIQLFGFATAQERTVFEKLLSVSGIGPKVALTILSGLPVPELVAAIATQNVKRLSSIPGVGKKLAERLGVELKEKMSDLAGTAGKEPLALSTVASDAILALLNLGYKAAQAETAVMAAAKEAGNDLNDLLRFALKRLAPK